MHSSSTTQPQSTQQDPDTLSRIGGWLFKHRSSIPLPLVLVLLLVPAPVTGLEAWQEWAAAGLAVVVLGEALRAWGVHHIGVISRTRSDRLGPLVDSGPFALVRNPLYLGNILIWLGFAISARLLWLAPAVIGLLALEYHAIVRWEERLLESRMGERYREYMARVPRWLPNLVAGRAGGHPSAPFSWGDTFHSERGTLTAIVAGYMLLGMKALLA